MNYHDDSYLRFLEAMKSCSCGSEDKTLFVDMDQKCPIFKALLEQGREFDYKRLYCGECIHTNHNHYPNNIEKVTENEEKGWSSLKLEIDNLLDLAGESFIRYIPAITFMSSQAKITNTLVSFDYIDGLKQLMELSQQVEDGYNEILPLAKSYQVLEILRTTRSREEIETKFSHFSRYNIVLTQDDIYSSFKQLFHNGHYEKTPESFDEVNRDLIFSFRIRSTEEKRLSTNDMSEFHM